MRERLVDAIAVKLGIDPNDVRRRNAISKDEMPYYRPLQALGEEIEHDSGDYVGLLDKLLVALEWDKLKTALARRRAEGEAVGAGFAMFIEKSGLGPADGVRIEVDTSGAVELITGGASLGQGFETVMAQVCAEILGVHYKSVRVTHGQTDRIAFGIGAHATRAGITHRFIGHRGRKCRTSWVARIERREISERAVLYIHDAHPSRDCPHPFHYGLQRGSERGCAATCAG